MWTIHLISRSYPATKLIIKLPIRLYQTHAVRGEFKYFSVLFHFSLFIFIYLIVCFSKKYILFSLFETACYSVWLKLFVIAIWNEWRIRKIVRISFEYLLFFLLQRFEERSGFIASTNWPNLYASYSRCGWSVKVPEASRIIIFVYDMKIFGVNSYCSLYDRSYGDKVVVNYKGRWTPIDTVFRITLENIEVWYRAISSRIFILKQNKFQYKFNIIHFLGSRRKGLKRYFCRSISSSRSYISKSNYFNVDNQIDSSRKDRGASFLIGYMAYDEGKSLIWVASFYQRDYRIIDLMWKNTFLCF